MKSFRCVLATFIAIPFTVACNQAEEATPQDPGEVQHSAQPEVEKSPAAAPQRALVRLDLKPVARALNLSEKSELDRHLAEKVTQLSQLADGVACGTVSDLQITTGDLDGEPFPLTTMKVTPSTAGAAAVAIQFWGNPAMNSGERTNATPNVERGQHICAYYTSRRGVNWITGEESVYRLGDKGARIGHSVVLPERLQQVIRELHQK